ncbi:MAG TPA: hypothetical protein VHK47_17880 [Polyangia bacterium]|nr:hypothetical protein [Polyangia bacterium]
MGRTRAKRSVWWIGTFVVLLPTALGVACPGTALAWGTVEHQLLGSTSYLGACRAIEGELGTAQGNDPDRRERFEMACGGRLAGLAMIYGDATAVAGDYVGHPSELFSAAGAWRFQSRKHYYLLALENSEHFNPTSTETWREYHQDAVTRALAAARAEGLHRMDLVSEALRESAFADHLLQDSFAAGHMGFNRRASGAAAAKSFHDYWNAHGRAVTDGNGAEWFTYGDGRLNEPQNVEGKRHVLEAATLSVHDVLATFVFARVSPGEGLKAARALPFSTDAPALLVDVAGLVEGRATTRETGQVPLVVTVKPVRNNTVVRAGVWATGPFSGEPICAASASLDLAVPGLPAQASFGAGGTLSQPNGRHAFVGEFGLLTPFGLSVDGLITHEVEVAAAGLFEKSPALLIRANYRANVELGTDIVFLSLGIVEALPDAETGWFAAVGVGRTLSAAGGGSF